MASHLYQLRHEGEHCHPYVRVACTGNVVENHVAVAGELLDRCRDIVKEIIVWTSHGVFREVDGDETVPELFFDREPRLVLGCHFTEQIHLLDFAIARVVANQISESC